MDIAALSVISNQVQLKQQASISVMKMVMNTSQEQTNAMLAMASGISNEMELSVNPQLGSQLNVLV
ncbi:MAG TPA: putative motility protein [Desulfitobacterium dehalogenans]|uniref:Putative motility protein n=1 Tax=Desulfitobacterium dehalogenans TaxID=36854 RepID=A0A7C7D903_9FIRM|nr:putative motility protein [Desulfitobacterium dehalogenans]